MSEKTLRQIGDEAKEHYERDKAPAHDFLGYTAIQIKEMIADREQWSDENKKLWADVDRNYSEDDLKKYNLHNRLNVAEKQDAATSLAAKERMNEHAAEYHDIAVIDAHMDGVAINVEQPITIGEQVEVHKS